MRPGRAQSGTDETSEDGFALVESIGVLLIGALVLVALGLTTGLVLRSSAAVARQADRAEVLVSGLSALRRDLSAVQALATGADPAAALVFEGAPGAIGFATAGEIVWIEALAGKETGTGTLIRSARPARPGVPSLDPPDRGRAETILSGPWTFRFSYAAFDEGGGAWTGAWAGRNRLPDLVRLDMFRADGRGLPILSLVEPIGIRRDRRCTFDDPPSCLAPAAVAEASP